jgi:hypothetical protein
MRKTVNEILQEFLRAFVTDIAVLVDQIWQGDVSVATEQDHAEADYHRSQMLLRQRAADRPGE